MKHDGRGRPWSALVLAAAALTPNMAQAQDGTETTASRTPESAQRFLSSLDEIGGSIDGTIQGFVKFSPTSQCKTDVLLTKVSRFKSGNWAPTGENLTASVDWSQPDRASMVTQTFERTNIRLIMPLEDGIGYLNLSAGSVQTLNRIMNAMLYLQEACDAARDTGF